MDGIRDERGDSIRIENDAASDLGLRPLEAESYPSNNSSDLLVYPVLSEQIT